MGSLTDFYVPIAAWVREKLGKPLPETLELRAEIVARIEQARLAARDAGILDQVFDAGLFPVVVWIDESLMCANWGGAQEWRTMLLQKAYFRTGNGGVEFFRRLSALGAEPTDREILAVYYMILQLGFQGQYGMDEDANASLPVRRQLQTILEPVRLGSAEQEVLFPGTLPEKTALPGASQEHRTRRRRIGTVLLWAVPPGVLLILFVIFDRIVHGMVQDVMGHLH